MVRGTRVRGHDNEQAKNKSTPDRKSSIHTRASGDERRCEGDPSEAQSDRTPSVRRGLDDAESEPRRTEKYPHSVQTWKSHSLQVWSRPV